MDSGGYFLPTQDEPRVRRARDAVRAGFALVVLLAASVDFIRVSTLQATITDVARALPGWASFVFWAAFGLAGVYAVAVIIAVITRIRQNPGAARDVLVSVGLALGIAVIAMQLEEGIWPRLLPEFGAEDPTPLFPIVRVAVVTAAVIAVSPHVARPVRRFGSSMILLSALAAFGLEFGFPSDAIASLAIGALAASVTLMVFGSPLGLPDVGVVVGTLDRLGVPVSDLTPTPAQSWGVRLLRGRGCDGSLIEVKAYGRDAGDTQVAAKVWRYLWYRDSGPDLAVTRMQAVEHEALMALFAERTGIPTTPPLTAGRVGDEVAILALQVPGQSLAGVDAKEVSDDTLIRIWTDIASMHESDFAHGSLTTAAILLDGTDHYFGDFASASLAAGDRTHLDVVSLLFSLSLQVGVERAVATAQHGLGTDRLASALPYLQLPALSRALRRSAEKPKAVIADLRTAVVEATAVEPPEPVALRRVSVGRLLMLGLVLFAANALIGQLAAIDYAAVWDVVRNAAWFWLIIAYPLAHLNFVPEAMGMIAAVGRPLPLRPLVILQIAARFIGLAIPSAAGRVAMNAAFLTRFGVSKTVAVVQGAIDGVSGFVVEAGILLLALILSERSFDLGGDVNLQAILLVVVGLAVVTVVLAFTVPKLKAIVMPVVRDALGSVGSVVRDPRRIGRLLLANFLARLAFGFTLWIILRSLGVADITIPVALAVTVATNLLAGLVPVPGGIGIAEAVLTSWLVLVGVPEATAFAATVMYRMWTFYLPAVEGFFALRWLEARDYL